MARQPSKNDASKNVNIAGTGTLLAGIQALCRKLASSGWAELFAQQGLDIQACDLQAELLRPLGQIDRSVPGFEDFAAEGVRAIEPCQPARSLFLHALWSPQVLFGAGGKRLKDFPTVQELELVENYVYGVRPPSLLDLRARAGDAALALVVFSCEYRPAVATVHQRHADFCYSRTGVSRVGTQAAVYKADARGWSPEASEALEIRATPARFAAYLAVQSKGKKGDFGPMRFSTANTGGAEPSKPASGFGDDERVFWVPVHKIFSGPECLRGLNLQVSFKTRHLNEKLLRVHKALLAEGIETGFNPSKIHQKPFQFEDGIAEISDRPSDGTCLVVPVPHSHLVERATVNGQLLTYQVPVGRQPFRSSLNISPRRSGVRGAPEYVHAREEVKDGVIKDLNNKPDVAGAVKKGGYTAAHHLDFTGDGYVEVACPELAFELPQRLPAYSIVAPVDFFPHVKQAELMQWWVQSVSPELISTIWPENPGPPLTLADTRLPANLGFKLEQLDVENNPRTVFDPGDDTISSIVSVAGGGAGAFTALQPAPRTRVSYLPDGAAGVFAPGWDCSIDRTEEFAPEGDGTEILPGTTFLNNYGLGSPFPEDAMLCAALSSFWPAAAPDITRIFAPRNYATTTPLTDDVHGMGTGAGRPWDGIPGPFIPDPNLKEVAYTAIEYGDYVRASLNKEFDFQKVMALTPEEYGARTVVMARAYQSVGARSRAEKIKWAVFSFRTVCADDAESGEAEKATGVKLSTQHAYRVEMFEHKGSKQDPDDHRRNLVAYDEMLVMLADPHNVLHRVAGGGWKAFRY